MFNFLEQKIFGLDLSDLSVKIAQLRKGTNGIYLASYGKRDIPEGVLENGAIKNEDSLQEIIKTACREVKGARLKTKYCVVSLPETEAFVRVVQLPKMKKEELAEAIKWETESHIPLPIGDVYFDWQVIKPLKEDDTHSDVLVGALNKSLVDPYLSVLKKAGLRPVVFEIESIATARSLVKEEFSARPVMIIDVGARRSSFIIFSGRTVHFTASVPIANEYFVNEISKHLSVSREEAKKIKFEYGLSQEKGIAEALSPALGELVSHIKKYIDFYREHGLAGHFENKEIYKILLCGGGASFSGLSAFLAKELKIEVETGNPWVNILGKTPYKIPELSYEQSVGYSTALGLALRGLEMSETSNLTNFEQC
jgi:type IV pilus assembly protein PilM